METQRSPKPDAHWGLVVAAIAAGAVVASPFIYFGQVGNGRTAGFLAGILFIAVARRWHLRSRTWFWPLIALIVVAESPLVIFVHWTSRWIPAAAILPFAVADGVGILWLIQLVEKWVGSPDCKT